MNETAVLKCIFVAFSQTEQTMVPTYHPVEQMSSHKGGQQFQLEFNFWVPRQIIDTIVPQALAVMEV